MSFSLSSAQKDQFERDGYLVLHDFFTQAQANELLSEARNLLQSIDLSRHPMTKFTTGEDDHVGDDYFLSSGTKISSFFEEDAFDDKGQLNRPKEQAVNKIGHALHELNPVYRKFSLENPELKTLARQLAFHQDPLILQSMIICKQPRIGGKVDVHCDSTFLYTRPLSALGFWFALEDCTKTNGCLSFAPGSHKKNTIASRFARLPQGGTGFISTGEKENGIDWSKEEWRTEECKAGTLVLIHGSVIHKSEKNLSEKSRFIYTFHMIENEPIAEYDDRNWLQPTPEMSFSRLFA